MAFLEVKDIYKSYGKKLVLKGVSFNLEKKEILSIIGSSGNGKTTLLKTLNFLEDIDSGQVCLNSELIIDGNIKKKRFNDLRKIRTHFGLVFQEFNLFPQYTAYENIRLPLFLREMEKKKKKEKYLSEQEIKNSAMDLLEKVGLTEKANSYPCEMSGGEKQRVAIARAMVLKPDILCFDEPTSSLDPSLSNEVLNLIKDLKEKLGITMIIVTHEMDFALHISDKVLHLNKGEVASFGTVEEVFFQTKNEETKKFVSTSKII